MQLKFHELASHLRSTLHGSYLLHGPEPLLLEDSLDLLRKTAKHQGFDERLVFTMETGFDWLEFNSEFDSLSLFSEKKIIELRMPGGKPGIKGAEILLKLAGRQADDNFFILVCGKLEAAMKNSKWVKQFISQAAVIEHGSIANQQLASWINHRASKYNLNLDNAAIRLLSYYLEGNLLAIDQEIKKFALQDWKRPVGADDILKSVEDSARFTVFNFVDAALAGHLQQALRMLNSLKAEGIEPVLLNWALARETRQLVEMAIELEQGDTMASSLKKHRVWRNRAGIVQSALKRLQLSQWEKVHQRLAELDRIIKGRASSRMQANVWTEFQRIVYLLC